MSVMTETGAEKNTEDIMESDFAQLCISYAARGEKQQNWDGKMMRKQRRRVNTRVGRIS